MGFWGIEVKPGKPYRYQSSDVEGTVYLTQATLGRGKSPDKCVLQCSSRDKSPVYLCSLLPDQTECCPLSLEFVDADDVVFSVVGSRSIHLAGKFMADEEHFDEECYDSDSFGEDIADTDTDDSNDYGSEDEYGGEFIDDDDTDLVPNSGVTIEEIVDDDKPTTGNGKSERPKKKKKKDQLSDSEEKNLQRQIVVKSGSGVPVLESEDEDGFPISSSHKNDVTVQKPLAGAEQVEKGTTEKTKKKKAKDLVEGATGIKRKIEDVDQVPQPEREKKKKKKHQKEQDDEEEEAEDKPEEVKDQNLSQVSSAGVDLDQKAMDGNETRSEEKKKKKNKKKKKKKTETSGDLTSTEQNASGTGDEGITTTIQVEEHNEPKPSQARTFGNGLVIEELTMGKPDGKRASPGKVASVHYTGKLKNGEIFDSSIGGKPFTFRLGVGGVIKGWDIGVNGMRIGDKRRLTIPPAMGYGAKGAGEKIPPDSWLVFDIELVEVR